MKKIVVLRWKLVSEYSHEWCFFREGILIEESLNCFHYQYLGIFGKIKNEWVDKKNYRYEDVTE